MNNDNEDLKGKISEGKGNMNCGICDKEIEFNPTGLCLLCYCTRRGWTRELYIQMVRWDNYLRKRYIEDPMKDRIRKQKNVSFKNFLRCCKRYLIRLINKPAVSFLFQNTAIQSS